MLPEDLLFSATEISKLDAQHELSQKERESRIRREKPSRRSAVGSYGGSYGGEGSWSGGDSGGDGGGCD
jgi:hypothetical protein